MTYHEYILVLSRKEDLVHACTVINSHNHHSNDTNPECGELLRIVELRQFLSNWYLIIANDGGYHVTRKYLYSACVRQLIHVVNEVLKNKPVFSTTRLLWHHSEGQEQLENISFVVETPDPLPFGTTWSECRSPQCPLKPMYGKVQRKPTYCVEHKEQAGQNAVNVVAYRCYKCRLIISDHKNTPCASCAEVRIGFRDPILEVRSKIRQLGSGIWDVMYASDVCIGRRRPDVLFELDNLFVVVEHGPQCMETLKTRVADMASVLCKPCIFIFQTKIESSNMEFKKLVDMLVHKTFKNKKTEVIMIA